LEQILDRRWAVMESLTRSRPALRFGVFELDLRAGALYKRGLRVKLQDQPFQILRSLLEHPGELLTRDELRSKIWAEGTLVDFDRSLNTAVTKLRLAIGDSAEAPRYIETVPRRGYRFIAPVSVASDEVLLLEQRPAGQSEVLSAKSPETGAVAPNFPPPSPSHSLFRRRYLFATLAAFLTCLGALYHAYFSRHTIVHGTSVVARRSIAVLGFKNLIGDAGRPWLSTVLSDWLSAELGLGEKLRVIPEDRVARMKMELALPEVESLGRDNLSRVRQNLGTDLVVIGSYATLRGSSGDQVRLDVHLQDTTTGETIATVFETGTESNLLDLVSRTGGRLRANLGIQSVTPPEAAAIAVVLPSNPEAARWYSEGLSKLRFYDALAARDLFQRAVAAEPEFALGHSALSDAWSKLGYDAAAIEEAKKASALSSTLPRAERLLVQARYYEASKNQDKAIETYRALFEFFPDSVDYGLALAEVQVNGGKGKEALETVAALHNLPPPSGADPRIDLAEASAADSQGDLKKALAAAERAAEKARATGASPLVAHALAIRADMLRGLGRLSEAAVSVDESKRIFAAAGDKDGFARSEAQAALLLDLQGDFLAAKRMYEASLATFRTLGDRERVAAELNNIGAELQSLGDLNGARKNFEGALVAWSEVREHWGVAVSRVNLGEIFFDLGDLPAARRMYEQSFSGCQAIGNQDLAAYVLSGLGRVLQAEGNLNEAWRDEDKAVSTFQQSGEKHADALIALSNVLVDLGKSTDAAVVARKALDMAEDLRLPNDRPDAEASLAQALLAQGRIADARKASEEALAALGNRNSLETKLVVATTAARIRAASNMTVDRIEAAKILRQVITDAKKSGFVPEEFNARLVLAEVELASGNTVSGRARLQSLEKDAAQKGWQSIARKATTGLRRLW
jgi:tetratricopeptide (TPR) repeat protein/DNA-binding winged helix-turn-helix (wHTH) protein/TolB-like protein